MRLPSTRSSPAGLPVSAGSPNTPSRSSRSWNASPRGRPKRPSCVELPGRGPGEGGADVDRALDGVLGGLVAQHRHRRLDVRPAARLHGDVEELARDDLVAALLEDGQPGSDLLGGEAAVAQHVLGPAEQQVAEQDRGGGAVLLGVAAPPGGTVLGLERAVGRGPAAPGVGGVHEVVVDERAGVQHLQGGARPGQRRVVVDRRPDGPVAPVAEGRPEPLAPADRRTCLGDQATGVGTERGELGRLLVEEGIQHLLDPVAEVGGVPGRHQLRA